MKFFFDTEFIEDGRTIDLISLAIVAEDGREYYAINSQCNFGKANSFVREKVLPHIEVDVKNGARGKVRSQIALDVVRFVSTKTAPEFWGYYCAYDWVVLCQLYGPMASIPHGWPYYARDLRQLLDDPEFQVMRRPPPNGEHHALVDARWNRDLYHCIQEARQAQAWPAWAKQTEAPDPRPPTPDSNRVYARDTRGEDL